MPGRSGTLGNNGRRVACVFRGRENVVYRGYSISPTGSLIGLLWALPDGMIGGAVLAWVYNAFAKTGEPTVSR